MRPPVNATERDHMKNRRITPGGQQLIECFAVSANKSHGRHHAADPSKLPGRPSHEVSHHLASPGSRHGKHCPLEELFRTRIAGLIKRRAATPSDQEMRKALSDCNGHPTEAARRLGISDRPLYRHLKHLQP